MIANDAAGTALLIKQLHQRIIMRAEQLIPQAIGPDIPLFQAGKMPVQRFIKIFPVSGAQRYPHSKADDAVYPGLCTGGNNLTDIFRRVIDKR